MSENLTDQEGGARTDEERGEEEYLVKHPALVGDGLAPGQWYRVPEDPKEVAALWRERSAALRKALDAFPVHAPRLLDISGLRQLLDTRFLMRVVNETPRLRKKRDAIVEKIATRHRGYHRPRKAGDTLIAFMEFTLSNHADLEPWATSIKAPQWREWGWEFDEDEGGPPYLRVYRRFTELEDFWEDIQELAQEAIRICAERDPRIGYLMTLDGTEQITTAALYHVCEEGECPTGRAGKNVGGAIGRHPRGMKATAEEATDYRHEAEDFHIPLDHEHLVADEAFRDLLAGKINDVKIVTRDGRKPERMRFRTTSGHWWETRDRFAGVRYYEGKNGGRGKFWHGRLQVKLVDHFTGAPIVIIDIPAGTNESKALKPMVTRACEVLGRGPQALSTDSAHWYDSTSNWLASIGCQHIGGDRRGTTPPTEVDDLGGAHCPHCNGLAPQQSFTDRDYPNSKHACQHQLSDECGGDFRLATSVAPRRLGPIPRSTEEWWYMQFCHSNLENVNRTQRSRYGTAQKHYDYAPKRVSPHVQTLRAQMGLLIEWLRIGLRLGYLHLPGFKHLYEGTPTVYRNLIKQAKDKLAEREKRGMQFPFGPRAAELGIGPPEHPPPLTA